MTTTFSRRSFVRTVGLGLAAAPLATAPLYVPSRAFGANDRVRLGFMGVGKMGLANIRGFLELPDVELVAICDVEEVRRDHAKRFVEEKVSLQNRSVDVAAFLDYREMLPKIDAIVISTPDHWHTSPLVHAALAKKDIYCEKPLTLTIEESRLAVQAVRKAGVVLQTGSQQRSEHQGRFRTAASYVQSGRLGRILEVSAHFGRPSTVVDLPETPLAPGLDWDRWLGQAPLRPYNEALCRRGLPHTYPYNPGWRDFREYSGGGVTDWGAHHLDILQWALGMDGSGPNEVTLPAGIDPSKGGARLLYKKTPVGDDIVVTHRTYGNGLRFIGTEGELFVSREALVSTPDGILKKPLEEKDVQLEVSPGHRRNFVDCIKSRKDPICRVEVGAGSAALCHLLNLAYWNKRSLAWDPKSWRIKGAPSSWSQRKARPGYELPKVA